MIDWDLVDKMVAEGYIKVNTHPLHPLSIYTYTRKTQFEWKWNNATKQCRGLVVDEDRNVVARPFKKFFELRQLEVLPTGPCDIYEKMDGSLFIAFNWEGHLITCTKGSFTSEMAEKGRELLTPHLNDHGLMPCGWLTYLFEVIYSGNRVVVDYGGKERLVYLGCIETQTAKDVWEPPSGVEEVQCHFSSWRGNPVELHELEESNKEGFVLHYHSGERVKVKFDEYIRSHKLVAGLTELRIWEHLKEGGTVSSMIDKLKMPDEHFNWARDIAFEMYEKKHEMMSTVRREYKSGFETRKDMALYFTQKCTYPKLMFPYHDGNDMENIFWKLLRPSNTRIFEKERRNV